ncbi:MAG: hypothetical protein EP330_03320 [Deltaproteobacteria bacterium]|nr:MAG: hypothetical protein EP330_03320 [Deltaproteobacteria bacterium]
MRACCGLIGILALVGCKGDDGEDTGEEITYPTGCIATSEGGSFALLADAVVASSAGTTITLCDGPFTETVTVSGKELTIEGGVDTVWQAPVNEPALVLGEQADVTVSGLTIETTRNGVTTDASTLTLTDVVFPSPGNYAVEGTASSVNATNVTVETPGWGAIRLSGASAMLTASALEVNQSTGNAVTLEQGASGDIRDSSFLESVCTNDGVNCLESDGWGVEITDGGSLNLVGNNFELGFLGGVRAESASVTSTDDVFSFNWFGMWIENGDLTANGTLVEYSTQYGILGLTMDADLTDVSVISEEWAGEYEVNDEDTDGDGVPDSQSTLDGTYGIVGFDTDLVGDGLEITGNNGGGIYLSTRLDTAVSLDLANSVIDDNAGWGIFALLGELTLSDVDITNTRRNEDFCVQGSTLQCDGGMWAAASDVTWDGGRISGNQFIGYIGIQNNHTLSNVVIADNEDTGVRVDAGALTMTSSEITGRGAFATVVSNGAVGSFDGLDVHDRSHDSLLSFTDGSSYRTYYDGTDLLLTSATATIANSTFARGDTGIQVTGTTAALTLEDSSFTDYNRRALYAYQGGLDVARTTFTNVGGYVVYCSQGTFTGQSLGFTGVPEYATHYVNTDATGSVTESEYTTAAAALYNSTCTLDLTNVVMSDVVERAIYASSGSTQLDRFTVDGAGASASTTEATVHLSNAADALLNDIDIRNVTVGHALRVAGGTAGTSTVRVSELFVDGVTDGSAVYADSAPDVRISGLAVANTSDAALRFENSTVTVDGTALASAGTIDGAGAEGVSVTGGTASLSNLTIASPVTAGMLMSGGTDHVLSGATVTGAGTFGMVCDTTPSFATCESLALDGASGPHSGCDDCASLAGL